MIQLELVKQVFRMNMFISGVLVELLKVKEVWLIGRKLKMKRNMDWFFIQKI